MNGLMQFVEVLFYLKFSKWVEFSLISFGTLRYDCIMNTIEIFNFLPLIINSVTTGFSFLLLIIQQLYHQKLLIFYVFYLYCILQYFYKHLAYHLGIQ